MRLAGALSCAHEVLRGWLKQQLSAIFSLLPVLITGGAWASLPGAWDVWQAHLTQKPLLPQGLPPLRRWLVMDHRAGDKTPEFVGWLFCHGSRPLYTPLGGSGLNSAQSIQPILKRRALSGPQPNTPDEILAWSLAAAAHCNRDTTPLSGGGERWLGRQRQRERRHRLGGSGAYARTPMRRRAKFSYVRKHDSYVRKHDK